MSCHVRPGGPPPRLVRRGGVKRTFEEVDNVLKLFLKGIVRSVVTDTEDVHHGRWRWTSCTYASAKGGRCTSAAPRWCVVIMTVAVVTRSGASDGGGRPERLTVWGS